MHPSPPVVENLCALQSLKDDCAIGMGVLGNPNLQVLYFLNNEREFVKKFTYDMWVFFEPQRSQLFVRVTLKLHSQ